MFDLKIIQINLQKCKAATLEFCKTMELENFSIALVQEPYSFKKGNKYIIPNTGKYSVISQNNEPILAAIIINTKFLDILVPNNHLSSKLSIANLYYAEKNLTVISIYCPPQQYIPNELLNLQNVINLYKENLIICGDFNCRSTTWNDVINDNKSAYLEEFIINNNLTIQNSPNTAPTFKTPNGQSFIDLTLSSANISNNISNWAVSENLIQSDHNAITFQFENTINIGAASRKSYLIDTNSIEPSTLFKPVQKLVEDINTKFPVIISSKKIEEVIEYFHERLEGLIRSKVRPRKQYPSKPEWWDDKTENARSNYLRSKSLFYKNKISHNRETLYRRMQEEKIKFQEIVKKAKEQGWKRFVSEDLASNPWGTVYKLAAEKILKNDILTTFKTGPQTETTEISDTLDHLLNSLLPDDDNNLSQQQKILKEEFNSIIPLPNYNAEDIEEDFLNFTIHNIQSKKAPGPDCLRGKLIKALYPILKPFLLKIYSACLRVCYFPTAWKKGNIKILLKDVNRPTSDVKNYRPITLLPILGKVFEKIIRQIIMEENPQTHSHKQFGFIRGKSTVDALSYYIGKVRNCNKKYMITIFIDIVGAFDNLWWPALFRSLRNKNLSHGLIAIIKSYLTNREVNLSSNSYIAKKMLTKGCPQGSVLGPTLWNCMLDDLLDNIVLPANADIIAYADDIAVIIESDARHTLLENAQMVISSINNWAITNKLQLSANKTKILVNKSPPRIHSRDIKIKIDNCKIATVKSFKYLGLIIDGKLTFVNHANYIAQKATKLIQALRRKAYVTWDVNITESMLVIYNCAIIPIVSYASEIWFSRLDLSKFRRKILSIYGQACRLISRCYVSVSTEAAGVIAGIPPLDLVIRKNTCLKLLRKNHRAPFLDEFIERQDFPNITAIKEYLDIYIQDIWVTRWELSSKGRLTFSFYPNPPVNQNRPFTFLSTQILSGHGDFGWHLKRIGKLENGSCLTCPQEQDTPWHRIVQCPDYEEERNELAAQLNVWPPDCPATLLLSLENNVKALEPFAKRKGFPGRDFA